MERRRLAGSPFYPLIPSLPIIFERNMERRRPGGSPEISIIKRDETAKKDTG